MVGIISLPQWKEDCQSAGIEVRQTRSNAAARPTRFRAETSRSFGIFDSLVFFDNYFASTYTVIS